jgi:hypothetical protein
MRKKREYIRILDKAIPAMESAIDSFNHVKHPYRNEATLLLFCNAWELLAKSVLVKKKISIRKDKQGNSISAEQAISKLINIKVIEINQAELIQQIISLRNYAAHNILPSVPNEIMHHLLFFGCKFFREIVEAEFPARSKDLEGNYLSLSFSELTTYADKVQKLVSKIKKSEEDKKLVWLLERGIKFDGASYISQFQFEQQYKRKKRIMPHLAISDFIKNTDMVRIVPVQAPKNYTADISLRKGSKSDSSLPVQVIKTDLDVDYPFLTSELAAKLGKSQNFIAYTVKYLNLKGDPTYHQSVRSSKRGAVQRYSQAMFEKLDKYLKDNPDFNPFRTNNAQSIVSS